MPMNREAGFMGIFDQLSVDVKHDGDGFRLAGRADNQQTGVEGRRHLAVAVEGEAHRLTIQNLKGCGGKGLSVFIRQQQVEPRIIGNRRECAVNSRHFCRQADFRNLNGKPDFCAFHRFEAHKQRGIAADAIYSCGQREQIGAFGRRIHGMTVEIIKYGILINGGMKGKRIPIFCGFRQSVKITDG